MKHAEVALIILTVLFSADLLHAQAHAQAEFLSRISTAYMRSDLDAVIDMTCWDGVSPEDTAKAIDKYRREIALTATKVELLGKEAAKWHEWKQGDTAFTYKADVLHTLVVHLQPGSKIQLRLGEFPVKDLRLPVGRVNDKLYLLRSIPKQAAEEK